MRFEDLTKAQRWAIADKLAEERLPYLNERCEEVHLSKTLYARYGKRVLDVAVSGLALLITLPINLLIGIITFVDVGSPVFFRQERIGKDGEIFTIIKFRNMRNDVDENGELLPANQRVTNFGRFVRKTSLDELLNFWSILRGDMSLIGPRPLVPEYYHRYSNRHRVRLAVRPGLECPPRKLSNDVWTWHEQFENDVWYVENISFKTDCKMFVGLVRFALDKKSANARALASRGTFMGYDLSGKAISLAGVPDCYFEMFDALGNEKHVSDESSPLAKEEV